MFGIEKLMDMVTSLSLRVAQLESRVKDLEFHEALNVKPVEEPKPDPALERINKLFAEGLDNLLSYEGRKQGEDANADE